MNARAGIAEDASMTDRCSNPHLLRKGLDRLEVFTSEKAGLDKALSNLTDLGDETTAKLAARLRHQIDTIEPSITMIGQVKAGKTSLVNAMVGWPGLLPADVNPWTSVVTSLHLDPAESGPEDTRASFRFFDQNEWDRLLEKGGRIGELAARAGHDDELEKVRGQIEHMREKSRSRLGRRFELLLGQQHDYASFDEELIERYVCLGDDFDDDEDDGSDHQGRFADITKSADLYIHRPEFPMKLCIRDTPGVNDTFMMREQITIRAIRNSRICVVVLSAQQALSTVDMALIRLISNIRSREVVIFVNRIDELPDPKNQIEEIAESIRATLKKHDGPVGAQIVFGSAQWATQALTDTTDMLDAAQRGEMLSWASERLGEPCDASRMNDVAWELSGVPALYAALAERISEGVGKEALSRAGKSAVNLARGLEAAAGSDTSVLEGADLRMGRDALAAEVERIRGTAMAELDKSFGAQTSSYHARLDRSHRSFLERATASLIAHLERHGDDEVWKYEPTGLRLLLRSAYQVFGAKIQSSSKSVLEEAAEDISTLYARAFGLAEDGMTIEAPPVAHIPPPVLLGQTIALDIQGNWWSKWWRRRRGYKAYATEFYAMIESETAPIVNDLKIIQTEAVREEMTRILTDFLDEQGSTLLGFADRKAGDTETGRVLVLGHDAARRSTVADTLAALMPYAA